MHPILCHIGPLTVYSYGLMLALAVLATAWLVARDTALRIGVSRDTVYDLVFWVVLCGIIGARLFYISFNLDFFLDAPLEMLMIQNGGLAWQGSFIGGLIAGIVYLRLRKIAVLPFLDITAPYIALGHAIGRIGCFLNGCCYGRHADWGVYFPVWHDRLVPTQIFMSVTQVGIFFILRALQSRARYAGQVFVWYLMLSSAERFVVEFFRADHEIYWGFSIFQMVCIVLFMGALILDRLCQSRTR